MKFIKTEHHRINSIFEYDLPEEDIEKAFGSIQRFKEIVSHMSEQGYGDEPVGEEPTDEEYDLFYEFLENYGYDREDDWWTDRKGGYETSYNFDDDSDLDDYDYDSDEETLH